MSTPSKLLATHAPRYPALPDIPEFVTAARKTISFRLLATWIGFLLFLSCSRVSHQHAPTITFIKVPAFGQGSSETMDEISGRVSRVGSGDRIVLYA